MQNFWTINSISLGIACNTQPLVTLCGLEVWLVMTAFKANISPQAPIIRGHCMKPTQTMSTFLGGNPSNLPHICIVWFPQKWEFNHTWQLPNKKHQFTSQSLRRALCFYLRFALWAVPLVVFPCCTPLLPLPHVFKNYADLKFKIYV